MKVQTEVHETLLKGKTVRPLLSSLPIGLDEHEGTRFMEQSSTLWDTRDDGELTCEAGHPSNLTSLRRGLDLDLVPGHSPGK